MQTLFHLVRHGSYGLLDRALGGRAPGHHLDEAGRRQAEAVAQALGRRPVAAVASSPIERALDTAAPIAAAHGLAVSQEPGLTELDCGEWTGQAFEALSERAEWRAWNQFRSTTGMPGGETVLAVQARAVATLVALRHRHGEAELVMVSHSDVIKALLLHALGAPLDHMSRLEIAPASRSVVALYDETVRVLAVNLPPGS